MFEVDFYLHDSQRRIGIKNLFFFVKSKIPGVTMAVDGTHIKIMAPKRDKHLYYNRKGFSSLNVMIVCDHKMQIRYVCAKYPGSSHDSHIWDLSDMKSISATNYRRGNANLILGDKGYPLQPWLITPFREPITCLRKRRFNTHHAKGRCCALHNIRLNFNSNETFNEPYLDTTENEYSIDDDNDLDDMPTDEASRIRDSFLDIF
ncbi:putative nuclease HARBI1 [Zeugodacus cucurbitae]|uniref:putative nuclease HARBI1 n=1 Tax=Zeugodacus cucurbitae TaxID=28588 RepID=UPI0023D912BF|nr:putative nuclease HARBI1 [Zeugodacus cucurbitae]